jgi:ATP-dependent Clp protease ATP-binding subunit ClpA
MFERYTEQARRALFFARAEASRRRSPSIESDHLLSGLIRENQGPVTGLLSHFQVMALIVQREIDARTPLTEAVPPSVEIPFSREVQHVLNVAREEADRLRHTHIGPEHLFLGLLSEDQSVAASILNQQGITQQAARDHIAAQPAAASDLSSMANVDGRLQAIKVLVELLSHADRNGSETAELVARIHRSIDALTPYLH